MNVVLPTVNKVALLTFAADKDDRVALQLSGGTFGASTTTARISVLRPNGTALVTATGFSNTGLWLDTRTLPETGTYTVLIDPQGTATGQVTVRTFLVPPDAQGAATPGGAEVVVATTVPGQNGGVVFTGAANQRISVALSGSTFGTATNSAQVSVLKPDGSALVTARGFGTGGTFIDTFKLPAAGTYRVFVDPQAAATGQATVKVHDVGVDAAFDTTAGAPAITPATTVPGQNAIVRFPGTVNQLVSAELAASTFGSSTGSANVSILKPDGTTLVTARGFGTVGTFIDAVKLPAAGTYSLVVDPVGSVVGQVSVRVFDAAAVEGSLAQDGVAVTTQTTVPGQNATLGFPGSAGDRVSLQLTDSTYGSSTGNAQVSVRKSDGTVLVTPRGFATAGTFLDTFTLPTTGTYSVLIDPQGTATGSVTSRLYAVPADATRAVAADGATHDLTTATPGQNGLVTFTATAGQRASFLLRGSTYGTSTTSASVTVLKPDGTTQVAARGLGSADLFIDTVTLTATGTYKLVVDPAAAAVGHVGVQTFTVPDSDRGSLTPADGPRVLQTTVPGQDVHLTLPATVDQRVSLNLTASSIANATLTVLAPDGSTVVPAKTFGTTGAIVDFLAPATGDYRVVLNPSGTNVGSITIQAFDAAENHTTATPGGDEVTVATANPGQNATVTFTGASGQRVSVHLKDSTYGASSGSATVAVRAPDGSTLAGPTGFGTGGVFLDTLTLQASGTYRIAVDPQGTNTGQVTVKVHDVPADPVTVLTPGGEPATVATTVPGQNTLIRFEGTADQRVSVDLTGASFGTGFNSARVSLLRPDGTALVSAQGFPNPGVFLDTKTLPVTGTYTLLIDPQGANTGQVTVKVHDVPPDITATIALNGELVPVTTAVPGQNAVLTSDALPGGLPIKLRVDQSVGDATVKITGPTGTAVVTSWRADWPDDTLSFTSVAGVHTISVDPIGAATGGWRLEAYTGAGTPRIVAPASWSSSNTPDVSWTVDASPAPLGFAVVVDQEPTTTPNPAVSQTSNTLDGPFADGEHWLHVRAILPGGGATRTAHQRIRIDTAPPDITALTSPTHPDPDSVYDRDDLTLDIVATDGTNQVSGIAGYSIEVDDTPLVAPNNTIDTVATTWQTTLPTAGEWWVGVRAVDLAGNVGPTKTFHVQIDTTAPAAPIITSFTHPDATTSNAQATVVASWAPAQGDHVSAWSHLLDQSPNTVPPADETTRERRIVTDLGPGTWWLHVRGADAQGRWGETAHFQIYVAEGNHLVSPRQGQILFGAVPLTRDGACSTQDESTHVTITPSDGGPSGVIGPLKIGDDCSFEWDTTETADGGPRWPDADYTLTLTTQGSAIADPIRVTIDNSANAFERIHADYVAGHTSLEAFLDDLLDAFYDPMQLPLRYQTGGQLDEESMQQFQFLLQAHSAGLTAAQAQGLADKLTLKVEPPEQASPPQGSSALQQSPLKGARSTTSTLQANEIADCARGNLTFNNGSRYDCYTDSDGVVVGYNSDRIDADDDGRPAQVQQLLDDLLKVRKFYQDRGFKVPEKTYVLLSNRMGLGVGFSPPPVVNLLELSFGYFKADSVIWMNPSESEIMDGAYLAAHEYFHQVVFSYVGYSDMAAHPMGNWFWNEALSEWAAHQALNAMPGRGSDEYAASLPFFLSDPSVSLEANNGPTPGGREYGGFILAEHLQQRFGDGALVDLLETAGSQGTAYLTKVMSDIVASKGSSFSDEISHFWQSAYVMEDQHGIGFTDPDAGTWKAALGSLEGARAGHETLPPLDVHDDPPSGSATIEAGGAKFIELEKPFYGGDAKWYVSAKSGSARAFIISMADLNGLEVCDAPVEIELDLDAPTPYGEASLPVDTRCPYSTLVLVNTALPGGEDAAVSWHLNLQSRNATVGTSLVEVGVTEMGNLIDGTPGVTGGKLTPALGLRMKGDEDTEVLGWGCSCEGWGVGTPGGASGGVSGTDGSINAVRDTFSHPSSTSVTSEVMIGDAFHVAHHFHPSSSPNLIRIDIEVSYRGEGPPPTDVYYRRVFDWDIPEGHFLDDYATMVAAGDTSFVAHTSDDGFANPDPTSGSTKIAASGFFEDSGPRDNGGLIDIRLGSFEGVTYKRFALFYGAATSEAGAIAAVGQVNAQVYSLGQDNPTSGGPVTAIFAVDGRGLATSAYRVSSSSRAGTLSNKVLTVNRDRAQRVKAKEAKR